MRDYQPSKRTMESTTNSTRVRAPNYTVKEQSHRYDSADLKPQGGPGDDGWTVSKTKKSVLSFKRATKIGTLNVRTVRTVEKREELGYLFEESSLQILAIQEHRILHDEPVKRTVIGRKRTVIGRKSHLITTTAVRNTNNAAIGGVGFVLSAGANKW